MAEAASGPLAQDTGIFVEESTVPFWAPRTGRAGVLFVRRPEPGQNRAPGSRPVVFSFPGSLKNKNNTPRTLDRHIHFPIIQERAPGNWLFTVVTLSFKLRAMTSEFYVPWYVLWGPGLSWRTE